MGWFKSEGAFKIDIVPLDTSLESLTKAKEAFNLHAHRCMAVRESVILDNKDEIAALERRNGELLLELDEVKMIAGLEG